MTLIPGDGIGPALAACVKQIFKYNFDFFPLYLQYIYYQYVPPSPFRHANVPVYFEEILVR